VQNGRFCAAGDVVLRRLRLVMGAGKGPRGVCSGAFCVGSSTVGIVAGLLGVVPSAGGPAVGGDRLRGVAALGGGLPSAGPVVGMGWVGGA